MTSLFYLSTAPRENYSTQALDGYVNSLQRQNIKDVAAALGVSAAAIAGAMAEENNDYWINHAINVASDLYALGRNFTSDLWLADYAAVGGDTGYVPTTEDKFLHPVYTDLGYGNFKMTTAIRLVQQYAATTNGLGLNVYIGHYDQLAVDLVDQSSDVTAKLYGLMIKEADQWFRDHNAYGADWGTFPQEIKDALYVTYVNLGTGQMETKYIQGTAN